MKFALYLNGFLGLSLGSAAVLNLLNDFGIRPERIYTCGISSVFANDCAKDDYEKRVIGRFDFLAKEFRLFNETFLEDSYMSKLNETYRLAKTAASRKFTGILGKKFEIMKTNSVSKPKLDVLYSAVDVKNGSEIVFGPEDWEIGIEAAMAVTPFFGPLKHGKAHLVSTAAVTGVPGFSNLDGEPLKKVFVNAMPRIKKFSGDRVFDVMMIADYARTMELIDRYSEKFDFFVDFSKYQKEISDFTPSSWRRAKTAAHRLFYKDIEKLKGD